MFDLGEMLKSVSDSDTMPDQIRMIPLELIGDDPRNAIYSVEGIEGLADNIATVGLQDPVILRPDPDCAGHYILVSGHRRRAAFELLRQDDKKRWKEIPAIVRADGASAELQELRLIYANSDNRKLSSAELGRQASRVTELLYALKEQGMEFPGRMRDHVAQACNISRTKLAELKVIEDNLDPAYRELYRQDKIPHSTAYAIAKLPGGWQKILSVKAIRSGVFVAYGNLISHRIEEMRRAENMCKPLMCPSGGLCSHTSSRLVMAAEQDLWSGILCRGCCLMCNSLGSCKGHCYHADAAYKRSRREAQEIKEAAAVEKAQRDAPHIANIVACCKRVVDRAEALGINPGEIGNIPGATCNSTLLYAEDYAIGRKEPTATDWMPIGRCLYESEAALLVRQADVLDCSIDYLLGRTDDPARCAPAAQEPQPLRWRSGDPESEGEYIVLTRDRPDDVSYIDSRKFRRGTWQAVYGGPDFQILGWLPMPEEAE